MKTFRVLFEKGIVMTIQAADWNQAVSEAETAIEHCVGRPKDQNVQAVAVEVCTGARSAFEAHLVHYSGLSQ